MNQGHDRIEELLAVAALDALDRDDVEELSRSLAEHGPDCPECGRLRRDYADVAGRLAFALAPVAVDRTIGEDILRTGDVPIRRVGRWRTGLVAAGAAVLVAVGAVGGYVLAARQQPEVADLARILSRADARVVRFEGPSGRLAAAVAPDEGFLVGSSMPALPEGRVYELWMIRGQSPVRGACVEPRGDVVVARFEADLSGTDALAVTVESRSCPSQPSTEPVYIAQL